LVTATKGRPVLLNFSSAGEKTLAGLLGSFRNSGVSVYIKNLVRSLMLFKCKNAPARAWNGEKTDRNDRREPIGREGSAELTWDYGGLFSPSTGPAASKMG
jgi:hypothetical protein